MENKKKLPPSQPSSPKMPPARRSAIPPAAKPPAEPAPLEAAAEPDEDTPLPFEEEEDYSPEADLELEDTSPEPLPQASGPAPVPARRGVSMGDLDDLLEEADDMPLSALPEMRLGKDKTPMFFFGRYMETVQLHYNEQQCDVDKGYFVCPGKDCPFCRYGKAAVTTHLMPVLSVENGDVRTLRVPVPGGGRQDAQAMLPQIKKLHREGKLSTKAIVMKRDGMKVTMQDRPVNAAAMGNLAAVKAFTEAYAAGEVALADTFRTYSPAELAQVPWVQTRRQMEALFQVESDEDAA